MNLPRSSNRRQVDLPPHATSADTGKLFDPRAGDSSFERLRAELLTNISDEIRTPLERIIDPLHDLVELHGGSLAIETAEGAGSTLVVRLQLASGQPEPPPRVETRSIDRRQRHPATPQLLIEPQEPSDSRASASSDHRYAGEFAPLVLIACDPSDLCAGLRRHLASHYRVAKAMDGTEALERARELLPDVVIAEVMTNGRALCRELKRDPELDFVPVIMVIAGAAAANGTSGFEEGADDYILRPFEISDLIARIDHQIAARHRLLDRLSRSEVSITEPGGLPVAPDVQVTPQDHEFLEQVRQTIGIHLGDKDFQIDELADALALDRAHLDRRLRELTGFTPARLVLELRLKVAAHQLADAGAPISEIAWMVGFRSLEHFTRRFKARFRMTPTAFRARW